MLLRKAIRHVQSQSWTAIAIDFCIVVLGVCVGIQVNNWNETLLDCKSPLSEAEAQAVLDSYLAVPGLLSELRFWITTQESGIVMLGGVRGTAEALTDQVRDELGK